MTEQNSANRQQADYIDLNCDMGESFGVYQMGADEALIEWVSSANIACGFHAGDPSTMRKTVQMALHNGVAIGVHPGLPDLAGFGRRQMNISPQEAYDMVVYQVGALWGIVRAEGGTLRHVKPHGALYNMAATHFGIAEAITEAVYKLDPSLFLFGLAGSELIRAGEKVGLRTVQEVFADRNYQGDGTLIPRGEAGALITDWQLAADRVVRMVREGKVASREGMDVVIKAETVCIHGDGSDALALARKIREVLQAAGIEVKAVE